MSGGHFDYKNQEITETLIQLSDDPELVGRFPNLAGGLSFIGSILSIALHKIDYDLSGDSEITEPEKYEQAVFDALIHGLTERNQNE